MNLYDFFLQGGFGRCEEEREKLERDNKVLRNNINNYIVDSCYAWDEGYETAIWNNKTGKKMVIVERYDSFENMQKGHEKWCKFCENNPKEVYSVQTDEVEEL